MPNPNPDTARSYCLRHEARIRLLLFALIDLDDLFPIPFQHFLESAFVIEEFPRTPGDGRDADPEFFGDLALRQTLVEALHDLPAHHDIVVLPRREEVNQEVVEELCIARNLLYEPHEFAGILGFFSHGFRTLYYCTIVLVHYQNALFFVKQGNRVPG